MKRVCKHTSKTCGRPKRGQHTGGSDGKGRGPSCEIDIPFGSLGAGEDPLLALRWRALCGNSRASSSPKRQTPNRSRICSTPSPSRSTPATAGLVPIRALKVRHYSHRSRPTNPSSHLSLGECTGHEGWKFDVDMETQMLGSVKPYIRQVKKKKPARHQIVPPPRDSIFEILYRS